MSQPFFTSAGSGCDFIQQQISDAADADGSLPAEVATHVATCAECGSFAEHWLHGAPAALAEKVPAVLPAALRERILDQNTAHHIVRFTAPPEVTRRAAWSTWAGRIAAGIVLAAFSYWLLNPVPAPVTGPPSAATSTPTLTQSLTRLEDKSKAEQDAVRTALVSGGRQLQESAQWSVSALEL